MIFLKKKSLTVNSANQALNQMKNGDTTEKELMVNPEITETLN